MVIMAQSVTCAVCQQTPRCTRPPNARTYRARTQHQPAPWHGRRHAVITTGRAAPPAGRPQASAGLRAQRCCCRSLLGLPAQGCCSAPRPAAPLRSAPRSCWRPWRVRRPQGRCCQGSRPARQSAGAGRPPGRRLRAPRQKSPQGARPCLPHRATAAATFWHP